MNIKYLDGKRNARSGTVIAAVAIIAGCVVGLWMLQFAPGDERPNIPADSPMNLPLPPSPELLIYKPLLPEEAKLENDKLPFSNAPLERALPLVLPSNDQLLAGRRNATDCLTSAIYYEAGNEISQGKRAVAQVILNRVRHPAYPKTICGVVYQGAERKTGCQFTFTCDGSLARRPARDRWEQARAVAQSAISGAVEPSVGMATHYHANYVMPYWASSLDKVSQIGTHIFYRWKGSWGRRRAFSQIVQLEPETGTLATAVEFLPIAENALSAEPASEKLSSRIIADDVTPNAALLVPTSEIKAPAPSALQADQNQSNLVVDEKPSLKNMP